MNAFRILIPALLLATALPAASGDATVTLDLDIAGADYVTCAVPFTGGNAGDLLDAAVASGCISSWSALDYGFGRYVDCIDGICGQSAAIFVGTFWEFLVDGESSWVGIDEVTPQDGTVIGFHYTTYAFLPLP